MTVEQIDIAGFLNSNGTDVRQHAAYERSAFHVGAGGLRNAPEELVLELFREIFYAGISDDSREPSTTARSLSPFLAGFSDYQKAAIGSLRGRGRRRGRAAALGEKEYYAPAYPELAAYAWFRKKTDRSLRDLFLFGALPTGARDSKELDEVIRETVEAVSGDGAVRTKDILLLSTRKQLDPPQSMRTVAQAKSSVSENAQKAFDRSLLDRASNGDSPLARRILEDWRAICALESRVPRAEWIQVLRSYLGIASGIWLLSQMRKTVVLRNILFGIVESNQVDRDSLSEYERGISTTLLEPSVTPCNPTPRLASEFIRARVELNLLLHICETQGCPMKVLGVRSAPERTGVSEIARMIQTSAVLQSGRDLIVGIRRSAESVRSWQNPVAPSRPGKNYDEFLRALTDDGEDATDGGALLLRARTRARLYRVFPSTRLISLFSYLSGSRETQARPRRSIPLRQLERHFAEYGVDFAHMGSARAALLEQLEKMGLLSGVPDAGAATELRVEYSELWETGS